MKDSEIKELKNRGYNIEKLNIEPREKPIRRTTRRSIRSMEYSDYLKIIIVLLIPQALYYIYSIILLIILTS